MGRLTAEAFDEIIIRQDKRLRGKTEEELITMLLKGIHQHDKDKKVTVIPSEKEAISYAITNAKSGALITMCSDVVPDALELVMKFKEEEANRLYEVTAEDIPNMHE